jgi:hypothetical protein
MDLFLCLLYNFRSKELPFTSLIPIQWSPTLSAIQSLKRGHLQTGLVAICQRFETGGSLGRRVKCRRVPQPRWVGARPSAKGGERWPETGVREVEIPRPSCSSRAHVGCACSRGLQASTRERERAASRERLSRPRPTRPTLCKRALVLPFIGVRRGSRCTMWGGGVAECYVSSGGELAP